MVNIFDNYFSGVFSQLFSLGEVDMGMIPAQTQLQTALAINLGTEGKAVSRSEHHCLLSLHLHFPCHATTSHYSLFSVRIIHPFVYVCPLSCCYSASHPCIQVYYGFGEEKLMKIIDEVKVFWHKIKCFVLVSKRFRLLLLLQYIYGRLCRLATRKYITCHEWTVIKAVL